MRMMKKMSKKRETGSIMLEVVAVLALMGVMGAMLFRQIYQRNQELHNIQMASEIRTVKEAFSAYIQANRSIILNSCELPTNPNDVEPCNVDEDYYDKVADYLPDGWFDGEKLEEAYTLTLWNYIQDSTTGRRVVYGIVVPNENTLPSTGWGFRRAARIALLVGADGGAYDQTITACSFNSTKECIAGSLGAWELEANETGIVSGTPTYVAITGIDIFSPEYEAPEGAVGLPAEDWSLALKKLHAYEYFAVGSAGTKNDCYTIQKEGEKRKYDVEQDMVKSDIVTPNINGCKPLFWVGSDNGADSTTGNVYVQNDLNVGADMTGNGNHALKLTAEGVIKQKDGLTIDKDGRIISKETVSADIGELKSGEHFVVDPAYTSTMNDIRLASRGGVRLSDILPNYILKDTYTGSCTFDTTSNNTENPDYSASRLRGYIGTVQKSPSWCDVSWTELKSSSSGKNVTRPTCPSGYKDAFVIIPTYFGGSNLSVQKRAHKHKTGGIGTTLPGGEDGHTHIIPTITGQAVIDIDEDNDWGESLDETNAEFVSDIEGCQFFVAMMSTSQNSSYDLPHAQNGGYIFGPNASYRLFWITAGYYKGIANDKYQICNQPMANTETVKLVLQTYCVWEPSLYGSDENKCKAAGYTWDTSKAAGKKCTTTHAVDSTMDGAVKGAERSQAACEGAGFTWVPVAAGVPAHCKYEYKSATNISNLSKLSGESDEAHLRRKAAVCKAAGYKWNGTACSDQ